MLFPVDTRAAKPHIININNANPGETDDQDTEDRGRTESHGLAGIEFPAFPQVPAVSRTATSAGPCGWERLARCGLATSPVKTIPVSEPALAKVLAAAE